MKRAKDYLISILLLVLLIAGQFGCTTTNRSPHSLKSPIPKEERRHVLNVAIVPAEHMPQFNYLTYDKGRGRAAANKAGELAGDAAIGGALAGALLPIYTLPYGILLIPLLPALIPAGALIGAVIGGTSGAIAGAIEGDYKEFPMDMEEAGEIKEVVENVYAMIAINRVLAEHIMKAGQDLTDNKFKITTGKELDSLTDGRDYRVFSPYNIDPVTGHDLTDNKYTITRGKGPVSLTDGRDYPTLSPNDTDIILKVDVNSLEFIGEKGKDPDTRFEMKVDINVIGAKSRKESYPGNFAYVSEERKFSDWTENNAQLLQNEFKHCYQTLSERIIKKIFLSYEQNIEYLLLPEPQTVQFEIEKKQLTHIPNYHENVDRATDNVETVKTETDSQKIRLEKEKQYSAYIPESVKSATLSLRKQTEKYLTETKIKEPWTGKWKVKGFRDGDFVLKLKQSGNQVKSTRGSMYELQAKVRGDRLKGWLDIGYGIYADINFILSGDCQSFMGKSEAPTVISGKAGTVNLKGERQE